MNTGLKKSNAGGIKLKGPIFFNDIWSWAGHFDYWNAGTPSYDDGQKKEKEENDFSTRKEIRNKKTHILLRKWVQIPSANHTFLL